MMQLNFLQDDVAQPPAKRTRPEKKPAHPREEAMASHDLPPFEDGEKAPSAFRTISEAATQLDVPQHVLRFWESRFSQIRPLKLRGGRRYYRPEDMAILTTIKNLLYKQGYTIDGAKKAFGKQAEVMVENVSAPSAKSPGALAEKKYNQLAVIRQELIGLRDILKPYVH